MRVAAAPLVRGRGGCRRPRACSRRERLALTQRSGDGWDDAVLGTAGGDAAREAKRADERVPVGGDGCGVVLARVPERAVVDGVDGQLCVVAPARRRGLRAATRN